MKNDVLDVIVVGAGHAGLSISYYLKQLGLNHLVFERGKIGESWRSQRWASFKLNTPNRLNLLPGFQYHEEDPDGFTTAADFALTLQVYASLFQLPVAVNSRIHLIERPKSSEFFHVVVEEGKRLYDYYSRQIVIASGAQNEIRIPSFADLVTPDLMQLHSSEYRDPAQLPEGAVLVVGSAQSGCQITEDLIDAGRQVFFSTSKVPRIPRRYRGKDILEWMMEMQLFDVKKEDLTDQQQLLLRAPQLTGTGDGKHTISLQSLARRGVNLLGKMEYIDDQHAYFETNAANHIQFADEFSKSLKDGIDKFISERKISAPKALKDDADEPDFQLSGTSSVSSLNLKHHRIRSIIWATGFQPNFRYIDLPVLDSHGQPIHQQGSTRVPGFYFLGLPWLRSRKSGLIAGTADDAKFISGQVYARAIKIAGRFSRVY